MIVSAAVVRLCFDKSATIVSLNSFKTKALFKIQKPSFILNWLSWPLSMLPYNLYNFDCNSIIGDESE